MKTKKSNKNTTRSRNSKRTRKQRGGWPLSSAKGGHTNANVTSIDPIVYIDPKWLKTTGFRIEPGNHGFMDTRDINRYKIALVSGVKEGGLGKLSVQSYRKEYPHDGNLELFMLWYKKYFNPDANHFYFTRHFNSCNNMDFGKYFPGKDNEPSAPIESLGNTYNFALQSDRFKSKIVYVSCLLRTWCTAVILYCTEKETHETFNNEISWGNEVEIIDDFDLDDELNELKYNLINDLKTPVEKKTSKKSNNLRGILNTFQETYVGTTGGTFHLKICPHLKENKDETVSHGIPNPYWERGNFPRPLVMTIMRFLRFLNMMLYLSNENKVSNSNFSHIYFEQWIPPARIILYFYDEEGKLIKSVDETDAQYEIILVTADRAKKTNKSSLEYEQYNIFINKDIGSILKKNKYYILNEYSKELLETQQFEYDIDKKEKYKYDKQEKTITKQWKQPIPLPIGSKDPNDPVHIVTHSNAMKQFFQDIATIANVQNLDLLTYEKPKKGEGPSYDDTYNITSQNCGTIEVKQVVNRPKKLHPLLQIEGNNSNNDLELPTAQQDTSVLATFNLNEGILSIQDNYEVKYLKGYFNDKYDKKYSNYNEKVMDKEYQYLCGKSDNTTPLIHDKMMTSKEIKDEKDWTSGMKEFKTHNISKEKISYRKVLPVLPVLPFISRGGSKQKRRTQRKRRKH